MHYDIFNGDADGIFSLHQYRLSYPSPHTQLITGVKRDICLLSQLANVRNCSLTVFDISLESNRAFLVQLLHNNNKVRYFDHHFAGAPIEHPCLEMHVDQQPTVCTSLIINRFLDKRYGLWAICGAFGDNLFEAANDLAADFQLSPQQTDQLQELGELFNYNGYGSSLSDLLYHPAELYKAIKPYTNPFDYLHNSLQVDNLRVAYQADLALAMQQPECDSPGANRVYYLPDSPWARRITGVFSNLRARQKKESAHAIITDNQDGSLRVSVRAPLNDRRNADTLCKLYPTGGGRSGAAGINSLPKDMLDQFLSTFHAFYSQQPS